MAAAALAQAGAQAAPVSPPALLAALRQRARQTPAWPALLAHRQGLWQVFSWAQWLAQVERALGAWAGLGLGAGETLLVHGPLSPAVLASGWAAQALGAELRAVVADKDADADTDSIAARWLLVDDAHQLERVLRQPAAQRRAVVVADDQAVAGSGAPAGLAVLGFDSLLAAQAPGGNPPGPVTAAAQALAAGGRPGLRVLADFGPGWAPGWAWLQREWVHTGVALVLPEPGGDAAADRQTAQAALWLASADRLQPLAAQWQDLAPAQGLAAAAVRVALSARGHLPARWLRARIRRRLGLSATRRVLTDAAPDTPVLALLAQLGVAQGEGAVPPRPAAVPASVGRPPAGVRAGAAEADLRVAGGLP